LDFPEITFENSRSLVYTNCYDGLLEPGLFTRFLKEPSHNEKRVGSEQ
jgi:hypothetical protein